MRYVLILIPFAAGLAMMIGGYYAVQGVRLLTAGNTTFGAMFLVYGVTGIFLGVILWKAYREFRRKARELDTGTEGQ